MIENTTNLVNGHDIRIYRFRPQGQRSYRWGWQCNTCHEHSSDFGSSCKAIAVELSTEHAA